MVDYVTVEIIKYAAIFAAEEMGIVLRNTAFSPNIRDRLDHSCAILTPEGDLVAQAEHIPVHLGSMSVGAKNLINYILREGIELEVDDIILTNDPYISGTHLNDLMVLKPIYFNNELIAFVVNKAHHVDIGGAVPGSIGGEAKSIIEEGIIIPPVKIVNKGVLRKDLVKLIESNVRTPKYFHGDLMAQIAALNVGERRIKEIAEKYSIETLLKSWEEILSYTERYTRNIINEKSRFGVYEAEDYIELSNGDLIPIHVRVSIDKNGIEVNFEGTGPQVEEPLNAVYGVTVAATTYALKAVIDPEMPMNQGFYRVINIYAPEGSLVNPRPPAPVSGGNVETSQRIADVVLRALANAFPERVPAASCGTMTNVMIGGRNWVFYETIGCGTGGRPSKDGVDGVHTNMTNTLNTPIEVIENEYPILFVKYELRPDSEGAGTYRGGLGITRAFKVLEDEVILTIYSERYKTRPWGLLNGKAGAPSHHYIVKANGKILDLGAKVTITLSKGDVVYINTPGGGGYGDPCNRLDELIRKDIEDGKISINRAISEYCYSS